MDILILHVVITHARNSRQAPPFARQGGYLTRVALKLETWNLETKPKQNVSVEFALASWMPSENIQQAA